VTYSVPSLGRTVTFGHDLSGKRSSLKVGANPAQTYTWDRNGRLESITAPSGATATFTRDDGGRVTAKSLPNNVSLSQTWDAFGRLLRMHYTHPATGTLEDFRYTYDENSNRISETALSGQSFYAYDGRNQLVRADYPGGSHEEFGYDLAGNRFLYAHEEGGFKTVRESQYSPSDRLVHDSARKQHDPPQFEPCPSPNENELCSVGVEQLPGHDYLYDGNGNQTEIREIDPLSGAVTGTTTYSWNAKNQLTQVTYPDSGFSLYAYFPDSPLRRLHVKKDGEATAFLWDAVTQNPLEDIDVGTGATQATHQHEMAMDSLLASSKAVGTRAYVVDPLNSVRAVIDGVGTTVNSYDYFAYGDTRIEQEVEGNRLRFTGRELEQDSGLLFLRYRWYGPKLARFFQPGPLGVGLTGLVPGYVSYTYPGNNPTTLSDPDGRFAFAAAWLARIALLTVACQTVVLAYSYSDAWAARGTRDLWSHCVLGCRISKACGGETSAALAAYGWEFLSNMGDFWTEWDQTDVNVTVCGSRIPRDKDCASECTRRGRGIRRW